MDIALKQRLVGASVLVALAVVVIPMLLGGRPEDKVDTRRIEVPEQPAGTKFETRRYPIGDTVQPVQTEPAPAISLPEPEAAQAAEETVSEQAGAQTHAGDTASQAGSSPAPGEADETVEEHVARPGIAVQEPGALDTSAAGGRYLVQIASFLSKNRADAIGGQLSKAGYTLQSDTVTAEAGTLYRVRVGPFATERDAERAVGAIKTQLGDVKPRIVDLEPGQSAPVTQPSDPMVRWVVQVAVLSNTAKADELVAQLKLEGLEAYRETLERNGSKMYRVRVGPFIEREAAIRVDQLIEQRLSIDALVMSAD
ncbi:MAG: SPOR domain-containing protein [Lysobacterales bacterium]|jgi:DedD protein